MKKEKNFRASFKDRSRIRHTSRNRGFATIWSSQKSPPDSRVSHEATEDICRKKRVRFADCDAAPAICFKSNASSMPTKRTFSQICDGPKTSEFKFYKKLQEDAGHNSHSSLLNEHHNRLKNLEARESKAGDGLRTSEFKFCKKFQEDAGHSYHSSLPNEQDSHLKNLEPSKSMAVMENVVRNNRELNRPLCPIEKVTPIDLKSPCMPAGTSRNSAFQDKHGEIFAIKRHKLLQIASETFSCGDDMSSSKRSDMVSEFLQRLGIESHIGAITTSTQMKSNIKPQLVASPEFDVHFKELPPTPRMNFMPSTTENDVEMHLPKRWYNEVDDHFLLPWNNPVSHSISTLCPHKTCSWFERSLSGCVLDDGRSIDFGIDWDTEFAFNRYGHFTSDHMRSEMNVQKAIPVCWRSLEKSPVPINDSRLRELDDMDSPDDPGLTSGKCPLQLLGWYDDSTKNEPDLSMALQIRAEPTFFEGEDHCWNFDSTFDASALCSPTNFTSSRTFHLDSWPVSAFGRYIVEERDYPVKESDHFPFTFYPTRNHLALTEDNKISDSHGEIELFHPGSSFESDVFYEKLCPSLDALLLSSRFNFKHGSSLINSH